MQNLFVRPVPPELLELLPWWAPYASLLGMVLLWTLGALLLGGIGAGIAALPLRGSRGKPWHERARLAYSLRVTLLMQMLIWPMVAVVICSIWPLPFGFSSLAWRCFPPALAALFVLAWMRFAGERRILQKRYSVWQLLCNTVVYHFALGHVTLVVALIAMVAMPWELNRNVVGIVLATIGAIVFLSCGGSLFFLRALGLLVPADERLNRIVAIAARHVGAVPVTYIARMPSANALAFPWNDRLAFSEGILQSLDDQQLESIAAHEICHLGMPTSQKFLRLAHALSLLIPLTLIKPIWGQFGTAAILPSLLALLAIVVGLQFWGRRLMQREEERADRAGAEANEAVYALVLEKIYRENLMPANVKSPQGHPPLYDRMVSSGVTPEYDKPPPPPVWIRHAALAVQVVVFLGLVVFLVVAYAVVQAFAPHTMESRLAILAVAGGPMRDVSRLGELPDNQIDAALGLALMEYARNEAPDDVEVLSRLARAYALRGRCEEASEVFDKAERAMLSSSWRQGNKEALDAAAQAVDGCR